MSSSQAPRTPFFNVPDDTGYRLIELPAEVQSLLEGENPPVLTLESSDTSALLKTPGKTYALRQKNTSNALLLLKPHTTAATDSSDPEHGLATISTVRETVELEAVKEPANSSTAVSEPTSNTKPTAPKGKWHERFGRNR